MKHIELSTPNFSTMQGVCQHAYPKSPDRPVQVCVEPKSCTVTNPGLPFFLCEILGQRLSPLSLSFFTCKMGLNVVITFLGRITETKEDSSGRQEALKKLCPSSLPVTFLSLSAAP